METSAGNGKIVKALESYLQKQQRRYTLTMFDIDPGDAIKDRCNQADFLKTEPQPNFNFIIQNPPFTYSREFIEHSLKFLDEDDNSVLVSLSRIGFLGAQKRASWWRAHIPHEIYISPRRPKFRGSGNDNEEVVWLVWRGRKRPEFSRFFWLNTEQEKWKRKL